MLQTDHTDFLSNVFFELRRYIPSLGVSDLLDALSLLEREREAVEALRDDLRLLWCRSWPEEREFDTIWEAQETRAHSGKEAATAPMKPPDQRSAEGQRTMDGQKKEETIESGKAGQRAGVASAFPVKTPSRTTLRAGPAELGALWPITRRGMEYGWQYLRRPRADGPPTVFDVHATVQEAARLGCFLRPLFQCETRDHSHLVLFVDRNGSMAPFHGLARDLVETARRAREEGKLGALDVYYFHNVVGDHLYVDPRLTRLFKLNDRLVGLEEGLAGCGRHTRMLVVGDAGAARGNRLLQRIAATDDMLFRLSRITGFVAWLNPMPENRWPGTSAAVIARMAPMFELTKAGFLSAIGSLRDHQARTARRVSS